MERYTANNHEEFNIIPVRSMGSMTLAFNVLLVQTSDILHISISNIIILTSSLGQDLTANPLIKIQKNTN
jgi:hypothetical protein